MEKYRRFVTGDFFNYVALIFGVILAVLTVFILTKNSAAPLDTSELEMHTSNLLLIEQDMTCLPAIPNVELTTFENGMQILLKGNQCSLKAYFDVTGARTRSEILDERIGSSFTDCIFIALLSFILGIGCVSAIQGVLYVPLGIAWAAVRITKLIKVYKQKNIRDKQIT